ncbi:MAG: hypothetical protein ACN2B6_04105 [Rickettsiales bacterium]
MSQQKSNLPMLVIGFLILVIAAVFGLQMTDSQQGDSITAEAPSPAESAFDSVQQSANEAFDSAQQAASDAANEAADAADQVAQDVKEGSQELADGAAQKIDEMSAEAKGAMAPAAGGDEAPAAPAEQQ